MVCPRQLQLQQRAVYRVLDNLRVNGFDEAAWRNALGQGIMTLFGATPVWWWVMTGGVCRPETELASEAVEQRIQEISPEADSEPYKTLNPPRPRKLQRELGVRKLPGSGRPGELPGVPGGW